MKTAMKYVSMAALAAVVALPLASAAHAAETKAPVEAAKTAMTKAEAPVANFASLDKNKDGSLSLPEFEKAFKSKETVKAKQEFAALDKNGDKKISAEEYAGMKQM